MVDTYPIFVALDGTALEGGAVYIGTPNDDPETAPLDVFWDAGLTIPAPQPIRTSGGVLVRDGSPAELFAGQATYSIRVRDRVGRVVWYKPITGGTLLASRLTFPLPVGPIGPTGSPGGNVLSVGDFTALSGLSIPLGTSLIQTSGATRGLLIEDTSITNQQLSLYPACVVQTANGRRFRRDTTHLTTMQLGCDLSAATDSASLIQQGIDYLDAFRDTANPLVGFHTLWLSAGPHRIESTLVKRSGPIVGETPDMFKGTALLWYGPVGGTMIKYAAGVDVSWSSIQNVFLEGNISAAVLVDLTTATGELDEGFFFENVFMARATDCAIKHGPWVNVNWRRMRFERCGNYVIDATQASGGSLRHYVIEDFTWDSKGVGQGFMKLTSASTNDTGVILLTKARLEVNNAPLSGANCLIALTAPGYMTCSIAVDDLTLAYGASAAGFCVLNLGTSTISANLIGGNMHGFAEFPVFGGTAVSGNLPNPKLMSRNRAVMVTQDGGYDNPAYRFGSILNDINLVGTGLGTSLTVSTTGDTSPRFSLNATGVLSFGNGTATPDTTLLRNGDGRLKQSDNGIIGRRMPVPASATAAGLPGDYAADGSFFYTCTAANTWARVAITAW